MVSLLWIVWCLYWPFYARQHDRHAIEAEAAQTYEICLEQKGMTPAACALDRDAHTKRLEQIGWPSERSPYQSFAGEKLADAFSLLTVLCLLPIVLGYALVRTVFEVCVWFARARPQDLPAP